MFLLVFWQLGWRLGAGYIANSNLIKSNKRSSELAKLVAVFLIWLYWINNFVNYRKKFKISDACSHRLIIYW